MKVKQMAEINQDQGELLLLKASLNKDTFNNIKDVIDLRVVTEDFRAIYKAICKAHEYSTGNIDTQLLATLVRNDNSCTNAKWVFYKEIINVLDNTSELDKDTIIAVLKEVQDKSIARLIAEKATSVILGSASLEELKDDIFNIKTADITAEIVSEDISLSNALNFLSTGGEFKFSNGLEFISKSLSGLSLHRGSQMIIFASPNVGKSTFVAQFGVGLLQQGHKVMYYGNEDVLPKILVNLYRTYYNVTDDELKENPNKYITPNEFSKLVLLSAHSKSMKDIEREIKATSPDVVVFDQTDNLEYKVLADDVTLSIKKLYQWTREVAAKYNCLVVNVTQASHDSIISQGKDAGQGREILTQSMMTDSKVGKSSTSDLIIGIGAKDQQSYSRCITACKNKINGNHSSIYCMLNPLTARYEE